MPRKQSRFQLRPISLARMLFCLVSVMIYGKARGDQVGDSKHVDAARRSVLPPAFTKKVIVRLTGVSLADLLDKLMPSSNALNYIVEDLPQRANADMAFEGTLKDALDRVADVFDMTWRVRKNTLVVFEKRFNNPDEHPQLILPELLRIARDMNVTLKGVPYQSGIADDFYNIYTFYNSLNPNQVARLERKEALNVKDLSDVQRDLMITALYSSQYQATIKAWRDLEYQLAVMPKSLLTSSADRGIQWLFYQYSLKNGRIWKLTLRQFE